MGGKLLRYVICDIAIAKGKGDEQICTAKGKRENSDMFSGLRLVKGF